MPFTLNTDSKGIPYLGNLDTNDIPAIPTEQYIKVGGLYVPVSTTNPLPTELTGSNVINEQAYNGSAWESVYNNTQGTLLPSAVRTTTTTSAIQTNYNSKGVIVFIKITAASGTGGLSFQIQVTDPVTGQLYYLNSPPSLTATGFHAYMFYPGLNESKTAIGFGVDSFNNVVLPRSWQLQVYHGDSSPYTYSVGYALIN